MPKTTETVASVIGDANQDAPLVAACNAAIAALGRIVDHKTDAELDEFSDNSWRLTREAMAMPVATLAGVRKQTELLMKHFELQGVYPPEHPEIELAPLQNLLRLLPA